MGINIKVRKYPKLKDVIVAEAVLDRDIRSCMRCRFFHNGRQCIANECVKMPGNPQAARESKCCGCPYSKPERYCFPCMKELLGRMEGKQRGKNREEEQDGKTY